jgi:hypothetical protein
MPLTFEEAKSLGVALGIKIPPEILEQKAKAEEFKARREKITLEAGQKPAEWRLRKDFEALLQGAISSAGQRHFETALKELTQSEQLLLQPDPPSASATAPQVSPKAGAPEADLASNEPAFQKRWTAAKEVWRASLETVDDQLNKVRAQMLATGDAEFKIIAERGLPALTDNHKTPVMKALFEVDGLPGEARKPAAMKASTAIAAFRSHLDNYHLIQALDQHSKAAFGVAFTMRSEIGKGLDALEQALSVLVTK